MIQGIKFDYEKIVNKAERVNKQIDFKSGNVKYMKKLPLGAIYCGLIVAIFAAFPVFAEVYTNDMSLLLAALILLSVILIVAAFGISVVAGKMNILAYYKLKKISKDNNYEVYKYLANIQAVYQSTKKRTKSGFDDDLVYASSEIETNGNKLIIENQEIYLDSKVYENIMFDKKIILYLAKKDDICILYDYERIPDSK